ncbi:MAG: HAMP domain-containing sensor histidine kinase [Paludibacter sp.]|nr:HAMP domain-containing sensor histidine kinase [Paludibacter sp.]
MVENNFSEWKSEIYDALAKSRSYCFAVYSSEKKLIFANDAFQALIKGDPCESLINPSYEKIISFEIKSGLVFNGYLTIGDNNTINTSIFANIYRNDDKIMIIGGVDILLLTEQNTNLHKMNAEIGALQRELLQKTHQQEITMKQLNTANDELTKANEDKDSFLKILAHDLRNPMLSISGFSELLLSNFRNYNEEKMEKHLNILHNSAKRTFDLLEELLLWSRSQSGKIPFEPKAINFKTLCKEVISLMTESAQSKEIDIIYQDNTDIQLFADANMLRTIMRNLISNAIKFSHSKGKITITAKPAGAFATITVSDNGVGIGQSEIARLWQISEVYTTPGTKGEKGTGFGLMLCKEFVDKHGGKIFVESEVGKGSDFQFTMPLYSEHQ